MKYFQKLKGERVYLSPISSDDFELYTKWISDSGVSDNLGVSWILYDVNKEREFLLSALKADYHFAIVKYESDCLIGNVSLFNIHQVNRSADFGIFIGDAQNRGKGYAGEAGRLILNYGFNVLNLNNIILRAFEFNKAAIACYERLGFKKIGVRRKAYFVNGKYHDEVFMDILREDWV